jgi:hypothetical protein
MCNKAANARSSLKILSVCLIIFQQFSQKQRKSGDFCKKKLRENENV